MNIIRLMGGIGNQIFQYSFGKAQELNGIKVRYDRSWYNRNTSSRYPRPFRLEMFNTEMRFMDKDDRPRIWERSFDHTLLNVDGCYFHGYWQYLDYHRKTIPLMINQIQVREEYYNRRYLMYRKMIESPGSVSIHIRRGDYLEKDHDVLPLSYYQEAMKMINKPGSYFIFSDDVSWCRKHFNDCTVIDHLDDHLSFDLMRFCKYHIISNSTFSWWGAMLSQVPGKMVICPDRWIVRKEDEKTYNNSIHYPVEWIRIKQKKSSFDVLVVSHEKDFNKLHLVIDGIRKNIHGYDRIFIVSNIPVPEDLRSDDVKYFTDNQAVDLDFDRIHNRKGWYSQQFIKLFQDLTSDDYLIVDSDLVINKPLDLFDEGKPVFFLGKDQNHQPYFDLMRKLFDLGREYPHSFINEIMFFKRSVIMDLLETFNLSKYGFYELVLKEINRSTHPSGFSEYELYGNFVMKYLPGQYQVRNVRTKMNGKHRSWSEDEIEKEIKSNPEMDLISLHTWT